MVRKHKVLSWALGLAGVAALAAGASADQMVQAASQSRADTGIEAAPQGRGGGGGRGGGNAQESEGPKPYAEVITDEAVTDDGIFTVHKVGTKYFYEIPQDQLDTDFLWVNQIKKTTTPASAP